jgi:hypothetical protein
VVWNETEAGRLMEKADGQVSLFGLDGNEPAIQAVARMVVDAHATRDLETLQFACSEFEVTLLALRMTGRGGKQEKQDKVGAAWLS